MAIIDCNFRDHGAAIQAIFNEAIANSTAIFETEPWPIETIEQWFITRSRKGFPVLGWLHHDKTLAGFASYTPFDPKRGYRFFALHSVYVAPEFQRQGIARQLMVDLIARAKAQPLQSIAGIIESENLVSIKLHESLGFERAGMLRNAGLKFGQWRHSCFYQLQLGNEHLVTRADNTSA